MTGFLSRVGFLNVCVMSTWLFNDYMNGVVREINAKMLGRGLSRVNMNQLLCVDDPALVADSEGRLRQRVEEGCVKEGNYDRIRER